MQVEKIETQRLIISPFTLQICDNIMAGDFSGIAAMGFNKGISWPDEDVMETLPRIVINLLKVGSPTGFGSWMIIKKDTLEIIGDVGFKGFDADTESVDIGYGIIKEERRNGYAQEAADGLINWAFATGIVKEITASCLLDNFGSVNLLRKLGFMELQQENGMVAWSIKEQRKTENQYL